MAMEPSFEKNLKKYSNYKNFLKTIIISFGVWPDRKVQSWPSRIFFGFFSSFAVLSTLYCMGNYLSKEARGLGTYMRGFGYMIPFISFSLKMAHLAVYRSKFEYMDRNVSTRFESDINDPKIQKHAMKHFYNISNLCWTNAWLLLGTVCFLSANTLHDALAKKIYGRIFPILLPYEIKPGGYLYWITFIYDFYVLYYSIVITVGADALFGYYVLHMVGEMGVLRQNYLNLRTSKDYQKDVKTCVQRHLMAKESLAILEKIFGFLTVWHATICQIIMCVLSFQVSKMKTITVGRGLSLIMQLTMKVVQTFSFAYFGYAITLESEECLQAVYESHWPGSNDKRLMKDVVILLSQKPMVFDAMSLINLSFDMFIKIMNASISYYMILRTLESKY